ncbi:hypothetical protein NIES4074_63050 (plasmid) [Cylindrospermum sp. NIES-4074]|nr:hypothetical protein NIES4074_63050 [Cylindrospermum sp. NIES-4074]
MATNNAKLVELKPELSRGQTKLMFDQAYSYAESFRDSIPPVERLSAAAAAWAVGAARQDELERKDKQKEGVESLDEDKQPQKEIQKKIPNFVFAAFGDEIVSRLNQLQFTELTLGTLSNESNNFRGKEWNIDEKYPIEIRASHHPPGHKRHASRLVFVQDTDGQYKEYAMLEPRTGQLPIGTQALANIIPGETYTANATVSIPGKPIVNFTIREISNFAYPVRTFNAEDVTIEIGTKTVPSQTVKIKLDGKTLGELDADSVKQLEAFNLVKDGQPLNLKLKTISENEKLGFLLASSPNGNLLRINRISNYDYKGQTFNDENYRNLILQVSPTQVKDAVFLNGQPLGVLFFKKDKEALKEIGVLQPGKLTQVQANIQSNYSTAILKLDPETVQYPQTWIKESQAFGTQQVNQQQQQMIEATAPILTKIKERPTILFASREDKMLGVTLMAVDNHKLPTVTQWLQQKNVVFAQLSPEEVPLETKKGLAVFNLVNSSTSDSVKALMIKKFGAVIESPQEYQSKVRSLLNRPNPLQPSQPIDENQVASNQQSTANGQVVQEQQTSPTTPVAAPSVNEVVITGKPIPMNYPLMMYGQNNPLPVDSCIDAMRGHGRVHTTRAYEPYKQYGFKEGDIAIAYGGLNVNASGGGKQVAFRVGKQYQITPQMIADPSYQQQWADMEKHSPQAIAELFTGKSQVWGLQMEPLGDYVDGKILPFPQAQNQVTPPQETHLPSVTIEDLRNWYDNANSLGKSDDYKKRIVEVANAFKAGQPLSGKAYAAMQQDKTQLEKLHRLTEMAQRIGAVWGQPAQDGSTVVRGKVYDLAYNAERKDLAIAHKNGQIIFSLESGKVQTNQITQELLQAFEQANNHAQAILAKSKVQETEIQQ